MLVLEEEWQRLVMALKESTLRQFLPESQFRAEVQAAVILSKITILFQTFKYFPSQLLFLSAIYYCQVKALLWVLNFLSAPQVSRF